MPATFDDLLDANRAFADSFTLAGFDGIAHAGVAVVTCIDSRIDPLRMLGLRAGEFGVRTFVWHSDFIDTYLRGGLERRLATASETFKADPAIQRRDAGRPPRVGSSILRPDPLLPRTRPHHWCACDSCF